MASALAFGGREGSGRRRSGVCRHRVAGRNAAARCAAAALARHDRGAGQQRPAHGCAGLGHQPVVPPRRLSSGLFITQRRERRCARHDDAAPAEAGGQRQPDHRHQLQRNHLAGARLCGDRRRPGLQRAVDGGIAGAARDAQTGAVERVADHRPAAARADRRYRAKRIRADPGGPGSQSIYRQRGGARTPL